MPGWLRERYLYCGWHGLDWLGPEKGARLMVPQLLGTQIPGARNTSRHRMPAVCYRSVTGAVESDPDCAVYVPSGRQSR